MKYATWKLNFDKSKYGTGPEGAIARQGFSAEAVFLLGEINGGTILGYFTGEPTELGDWDFQEIGSEEALSFALAVNPTAGFDEEGRFTIEVQGE
jgi:hypothetical protein